MVLRRLGRTLWWGAAAVIVALAVALSAARMLLPGMAEYREQVETLVEGVLHRPVEIGSMSAAWHRLSPVLRLQQVVVQDETFPNGQLVVGEVQVGLDILESLWRRKWLTSGIRIIGVRLALQTDLSAGQTDTANMKAFYQLMRQKNVSLEQVTLDWQDPGVLDQPVRLTDLSARIRTDGWRHQLLIQTGINDYYGQQIKLAADLSGPLRSPLDWRGTVYLETQRFRLPSVERLVRSSGYAAEGEVDLKVWARVRNRKLRWSAGSVHIARPALTRRNEPDATYAVDSLSSRFSLRAVDKGWSLELQDFSLLREQMPVWPYTRLRATVRNSDGLSVHGRISRVIVSEAGRMLPLLPWVDREAHNHIQRMQPRGELTATEFELRLADGKPPHFSLRSHFDQLGVSADGGALGATGLSGRLEGNLQAGSIELDTRAASLQLPKAFSVIPDISRLSGTVRWQQLSDRFRVSTDQLSLVSGLLKTRARLQLDWLPGNPVPWIDMQLEADAFPITEVKRYLPDRLMKPKALKWLRGAFRNGTVRDTRFLLQGPLNHVPFDDNDGRMEVRFNFDDVLLDYHPLWGKLNALQGSALFVDRSMRITADSATILDANVDRAVAVIENFAKPVLNVDGTVSGTLESLLAYINYSPLRDHFGKLVDRVTTAGDANLQLDLRIPLHHDLGKVQVAGEVGFLNDSLKINDSDIVLDEVNGTLRFSDKGVNAKDVSARLFGHAVKVSVYPKEIGGGRRTVIDVAGKLALVDKLEKQGPAFASYVQGAAYWHALLQIPADATVADRSVVLELRSDLKGIAIKLPPPFGKSAGDVRPVSIRWMPGKLSSEPLRVMLDNDVTVELLMRESLDGLRKAAVHFGEGGVKLPAGELIRVDGWLDELDLDAWIDLLRNAVKRGTGTAAPVPPVSTDLHVRQAALLGYFAQGLRVSSQADAPWQFTIGGRDMVGQARWEPASGAGVPRLVLRLERLTAVRDETVVPAGGKRTLTPERLPNLDLDIGELKLGAYALGKVVVRGERVPEGMRFPVLQVDSRAIAFVGEGAWLKQGEQHSTRFRAEITGGELGELIKMFGDRGSIQGGRMKGRVSLDWPGNPAEFRLASIEGEIRLETGKGRLVEVKEGAGKLLNLFNLNSLQRRLSLDFTDLTREGFSFDKMKGTFVISDGNAYTENFVIRGSSAIIEISGRTGLVARDYDQLVIVTPQVSSSLPLASALAGGPAVGAAVFLAEKLVGKEFNRMAQVRYKVTGSWDKPVYTRLKPESRPDKQSPGGDNR